MYYWRTPVKGKKIQGNKNSEIISHHTTPPYVQKYKQLKNLNHQVFTAMISNAESSYIVPII